MLSSKNSKILQLDPETAPIFLPILRLFVSDATKICRTRLLDQNALLPNNEPDRCKIYRSRKNVKSAIRS